MKKKLHYKETKESKIEKSKLEFICAERAYFRGGNLLRDKLKKFDKILSGKDMLDLFNTYGLTPYNLKLLAYSHGFELNEENFLILLEEQEEKMKNVKPCNTI